MNQEASRSDEVLRSFSEFVSEGSGIRLYDYQLQPARAILDSIRLGLGLTIVLNFIELSGKDELLAHLETYLMRMLNDKEKNILVINTCDKHHLIAVMRLGDRLNSNVLTQFKWKMDGMDFSIDKCRTSFLSMEAITVRKPPRTNLLLIMNEAQTITTEQAENFNTQLSIEQKITRVVCGTKIDDGCFLADQMEQAKGEELKDGEKRLFQVSWQEACEENKIYEQKFYTLATFPD